MHPSLQKLTEISKRSSRTILGLMSGTSLDGLDLALCKMEGFGRNTRVTCQHHHTLPYTNSFRSSLKSTYAQSMMDAREICKMHIEFAEMHANLVLESLKSWGIATAEVDLLASHGQTLFHFPQSDPNNQNGRTYTWQIGDGDHLAVRTGIITLSDFRQKQLAAGGEGAPLAAYGDYLLFQSETTDRILLNLGGIANLTYLPQAGSFRNICCTDIGPANGLMDRWVNRYWPEQLFDLNGKLASRGKLIPSLLKQLSEHPFFKQPFPKSTGPELFNDLFLDEALNALHSNFEPTDVLYTLNKLTADLVLDAILFFIKKSNPVEILISGGGRHNDTLMQQIKAGLPINHTLTDSIDFGIPSDAKEAILFAVLANETVCGSIDCSPGTISHPAVSMGKISLPF
jgi:anhydro-N-acetylmuramic acid kinase